MTSEEVKSRVDNIRRSCSACVGADSGRIKQEVEDIATSLLEINQARKNVARGDLERAVSELGRIADCYRDIPMLVGVLESQIHFLGRHLVRGSGRQSS